MAQSIDTGRHFGFSGVATEKKTWAYEGLMERGGLKSGSNPDSPSSRGGASNVTSCIFMRAVAVVALLALVATFVGFI